MEVYLIRGLQLVLALSLLVVVHEFGHFLFARIFKVRVEKFYLFFNPWFSLFKFKPKNSDTEYGIGWLPLGGYVKIAGMIDESMDKEQLEKPEQPYEFRSKSAFARLMIMIGGVLFNFLLALIIYTGIAFYWGDAYMPLQNIKAGMEYSELAKEAGFKDGDIIVRVDGEVMEKLDMQKLAESKEVIVLRQQQEHAIALPADFMRRLLASKEKSFAKARYPFVIKEVVDGGIAQQAGVLAGDSLVAINNQKVASYETVIEQFQANKGELIYVSFARADSVLTFPLTISEQGTIQVALKNPIDLYDYHVQHYTLLESIPVGVQKGVDKLTSYVASLKYLFTKEGAQSVGGFVAIAKIFPSQWNWQAFWEMSAFLSIMLGFMNILPIPALDGGHVMFLLYEVITRRKPNEKFMEYTQMVGMMILFALLIFANGNDLYKMLFN